MGFVAEIALRQRSAAPGGNQPVNPADAQRLQSFRVPTGRFATARSSLRLVEAPPHRSCQALGEPAYIPFARKSEISQLETCTAIDEDLVRAVDQHVGHAGLVQQRLQRPVPTLCRRSDSTVSSTAESLTMRPSARMAVATSTGDQVRRDNLGPNPMPRPGRLDSRLRTERRSWPGRRLLFGRVRLQQITELTAGKSSQRATR